MKRGHVDVDDVLPASSKRLADAISAARSSGTFSTSSRMPWELTPTLRTIFSGNTTPWLDGPKIDKNAPPFGMPQLPYKLRPVAVRAALIHQAVHKAASGKVDTDRTKVILKWSEIILAHPSGSRVGLQLISENAERAEKDKSFRIIEDTLRSRATSTLQLRASSLALYIKWFRDRYGETSFLPFKEQDVYGYLDDLRTKGCSPSRGTTFVGTLSFVGDLLGMEGVQECTESARVKGVSLGMFLEKRPLRQAPELWPIMVVTLEIACFCEKDTYLRAIAGSALCCIFGRLRVSGLNRRTFKHPWRVC